MEPRPELDALATEVYYQARAVRDEVGIGVYETIYERLLAARLRDAGHDVATQVPIHLFHGGEALGLAGRVDLVIDGTLAAELKATIKPHPVHEAQLLTYLRLGNFPLGLLIDFYAVPFRTGVARRVNSFALTSPGARGVSGVRGVGTGPMRLDDRLNQPEPPPGPQ